MISRSFQRKREMLCRWLSRMAYFLFSFSFSFTNYRIHSLVLLWRKYVSTGDGKTSQTYFIFSVVGNSRTNEYRQNEVKAITDKKGERNLIFFTRITINHPNRSQIKHNPERTKASINKDSYQIYSSQDVVQLTHCDRS